MRQRPSQETTGKWIASFFSHVKEDKDFQKSCDGKESYMMAKLLIIQAVAGNTVNGCNWAIIPKSEETTYKYIVHALPNIDKDPHFDAWKLTDAKGESYGCVVLINLDYFYALMDKYAPQDAPFEQNMKNNIENLQAQSLQNLNWYLTMLRNNYNANRKPVNPYISIYNTNKTDKVQIQKQTLYAFRVTLEDLLYLCAAHGFLIVVNNIEGPYNKQRISPASLLDKDNQEFFKKFRERLRYTTGANCVMIQISLATDEDMKKVLTINRLSLNN
jgi:hypothetical protein